MAALRAQLLSAVGEAGIRRVAAALIKNLEHGDLESGRLLLKYCVGGVLPTVDPDRLDSDELQKAAAGARVANVLRTDTVSVPAGLAVAREMQRTAFLMTIQANPLLGQLGWERVLQELGDEELLEWFREYTVLTREAQQAQAKAAAAAGRKAASADGGGGSDK
jgi:hypothetical protein